MKNFITKKNIWFRIQQLIIFVLHLILLKWMYFVLSNSGAFSMTEVIYHFAGMSIMGAVLIRGCAYWARYHYLQELKLKHQKEA
ncbi:MAG: hypothetical protein Q7U04_14710 [Bacteriovorax sp.]|nr:hypothetical protein [Bacteriovorax sp.]